MFLLRTKSGNKTTKKWSGGAIKHKESVSKLKTYKLTMDHPFFFLRKRLKMRLHRKKSGGLMNTVFDLLGNQVNAG